MNNRFSLDRLGMLWRFYAPAIKLQWTVGGIAVVASYFMMLFGIMQLGPFGRPEGPFPVPGFLSFYLGNILVVWAYYTAPLILAMCSRRRCETVLPALWQEKAVFAIGYSFVLYPLFLTLLLWICVGASLPFTDCAMIDSAFLSTLNDVPAELQPFMASAKNYTYVYLFMVIACCLYAVSFSRRARLAKGIVGILVGLAINAIGGLCIGIYIALKGITQLRAPAVFDKAEIISNVIGHLEDALWVWVAVIFVVTLLLVAAVVWKIKNRQD